MVLLPLLLAALSSEAAASRRRLQELGERLKASGPRLSPVQERVRYVECAYGEQARRRVVARLLLDSHEDPAWLPLIAWLGREAKRTVYPVFNAVRLLDWFHATHPNLFAYTLEEAIIATDAWHDSLRTASGFRQPVPPALVVVRFPDGAHIDRLVERSQFADEGASMGHCVGGPLRADGRPNGDSSYWKATRDQENIVYSYRNPEGVPQATVEVAPFSLHGVPIQQLVHASLSDLFVQQMQGPEDRAVTDSEAVGRFGWFLSRFLPVENLKDVIEALPVFVLWRGETRSTPSRFVRRHPNVWVQDFGEDYVRRLVVPQLGPWFEETPEGRAVLAKEVLSNLSNDLQTELFHRVHIDETQTTPLWILDWRTTQDVEGNVFARSWTMSRRGGRQDIGFALEARLHWEGGEVPLRSTWVGAPKGGRWRLGWRMDTSHDRTSPMPTKDTLWEALFASGRFVRAADLPELLDRAWGQFIVWDPDGRLGKDPRATLGTPFLL